MAAAGLVVALVGVWAVISLGPSGKATFAVTSKAPGAIEVTSGVLNAVDVPVRVSATRRDGGAIWLGVAPAVDARAVLSTSAVSRVSGVRYPAGTLDLRASGAGALTDLSRSDVWRLSARRAGSAVLLVDQVGEQRGPETVVVGSGDASALTDVTLTLTWANRPWFFEALLAAMFGGVMATFALTFLWHGRGVQGSLSQVRGVAGPGDGSGTPTPEAQA